MPEISSRHDHVQVLQTLKALSTCWKIPFRYLNRLSDMPGFPPPFRMPRPPVDRITKMDYLYSREAVRDFLVEHIGDLPQDDARGYAYTKEHLNGKRKEQRS